MLHAWRNSYKVLIGKPEGKRTFWKPTNGWDYKIEMEYDIRMWIGFIWLRTETSGRFL
jgi:hypothetical protein